MALFGTENKKEIKKVAKKANSDKTARKAHPLDTKIHDVLRSPRITEKATFSAERNVYVFDINIKSTKAEVAHAFEVLYGVVPVKINVTNIPAKKKLIRGKWGKTTRGRKASITLKEGDKIEII